MNPKAQDFRLLVTLIEVCAIAGFIFLYYTVPSGVDKSVLATNLAVFYLLFIRSLRSPERIIPTIPTPLSFETLFLFMSYLVFYHNYQLYLFGASDLTGGARYWGNAFIDGSNSAITLSTVGMLAFTTGYRVLPKIASRQSASVQAADDSKEPSAYANGMALVSTGLLLALVSLYLLQGWRSAGEGRYTGTTTSEGFGVEGVYVATSMLCMIVSALWVYTKMQGYETQMALKAGLVLTVVWCLRLTAFGDRNVVQLVAMAAAGGYYTFVRRPSRVAVIAVALFALYLYGLIEIARAIPEWYMPGNLIQLVQNPEFLDSLLKQPSFNLTTISLRATVEAVPETYDYLHGEGKILHTISIIPFAGKALSPYLRPEYLGSASLIHDIMVGPWGAFAPGTNIISDSFIDFSLPGVVVTLFGLGVLAKAVRNVVARDPNSLLRVVVYLLCLALYSQLPRYSVESLLRPIAWTLLIGVGVGVINSDPSPSESRSRLSRLVHQQSPLGRHRVQEPIGRRRRFSLALKAMSVGRDVRPSEASTRT